jgi:DNA-binding response OmpR family regulator
MAKILVVDDNAATSNDLIAALEDAGHKCDVARTVRQAKSLMSNHVDLVITDWILPEDGALHRHANPHLAITNSEKLIREIQERYAVPVIAYTEGYDPILDKICQIAGVQTFGKPENEAGYNELVAAVNGLLVRQKNSNAAKPKPMLTK